MICREEKNRFFRRSHKSLMWLNEMSSELEYMRMWTEHTLRFSFALTRRDISRYICIFSFSKCNSFYLYFFFRFVSFACLMKSVSQQCAISIDINNVKLRIGSMSVIVVSFPRTTQSNANVKARMLNLMPRHDCDILAVNRIQLDQQTVVVSVCNFQHTFQLHNNV